MSGELFVSWRDDRVLHRDDDLLVVDKPAGISTHAPDGARRDDVVSRLQAWTAARDGVAEASVYVGVHQRLDRDTSGVLLFARRREANKGLAAAFEGRQAQKTYVAVVRPAPREEGGTLEHLLAPGDEGRMRVVEGGRVPKDAVKAVTKWRVRERRGDRALLELTPLTGRTHQLRVQLAARGSPIDGDVLYGTVAAPRLMLHAESLSLAHPTTGKPARFVAPVPAELAAWARGEDDPRTVAERLEAAADQRWELARTPETTAFRIAHDGDGFAATPVDVYGEWAVVHGYDAVIEEALTGALLAGGLRGVYAKYRPKQANTVADTRRGDLAPKHAVAGEDAPDPYVIRELGLAIFINGREGNCLALFWIKVCEQV